jgi:hypothetical protein
MWSVSSREKDALSAEDAVAAERSVADPDVCSPKSTLSKLALERSGHRGIAEGVVRVDSVALRGCRRAGDGG